MLADYIKKSAQEKGIALMTHIICGYPSFEDNRKILDVMDAAGVEIVEMQFPFSEPVADGPLFAKANQVSLENGTTISDCFAFVKECSQKYSFKILMMGYYNTVFKRGEKNFCTDLAAAGGVGMIIPDIAIEESVSLRAHAKESGLAVIQLVAPTNTSERIAKICSIANESDTFMYAVARKGVTGNKTELSTTLEEYLAPIRKALTVPLAVGFGIKSRSDIDFLRGKVDIAVLGTAILSTYETAGAEGLRAFFTTLR